MDLRFTDTDLPRLAILTIAIFALLAISELWRKRLNIQDETVRKIVHIGTGLIIFLAPPLFPRAGAVVLIAALFVLFNTVAYARGWLRAVHHRTRPSYGTVYYPLSLLLLAVPFWNDTPSLVVASIMVMAVGDAAAGIVGAGWPDPLRFSVTSDSKTLQGSTAMFLGACTALLLVFLVYSDGNLHFTEHLNQHPWLAVSALLAIALFTTGWEAASSRGLDNLTVPLAAALALHICFSSPDPAPLVQFITGTGLGAAISLLAWRLRMLTISGAIATFLLAVIVFGIGGWKWTLPILTFFVLSSILSRLSKKKKPSYDALFEKSGTRDAGQVAANGGIAGTLILSFYITGDETIYFLYLASLAVVTADTWGTETGVLSGMQPRSILGLRSVPPGTSGGITAAGSAAGALGAALVILSAAAFIPQYWLHSLAPLVLVGMAGSVIDSLLGATVQAQYTCVRCHATTERRLHCGVPATKTRGFSPINNDMVNLLAALTGVALAALLFMVL
jgi:uncharacterized protein (TIGR00297 family)